MLCLNGHGIRQGENFCTTCGAAPATASNPSFTSLSNPASIANENTSSMYSDTQPISKIAPFAIASLVLGITGISVLAIIFGAVALSQVKKRSLRGRGFAIAGLALGIVWTLIWVTIAIIPSESYSVKVSTTLYRTTCSDVSTNYSNFNSSRPVVVYSSSGKQLASGTYGRGVTGSDNDQTGSYVDTCTFSAIVSGISKGLKNYTIADNGDGFGGGVSFTEHEISAKKVGMSRGYVPENYTINFSTTLYGTTCSGLSYNYSNFNSSRPVVVYSGSGEQIASGTYGAGTTGTAAAESGNTVDTCTFSSTINQIPRGLGNYVVDDNSEGLGGGVSYTEQQMSSDNVSMSRGYDSY